MPALQSPVTTATNALGSASAGTPTTRNLAIGTFLASDRPIRIVPSFTTGPSPLPLCTTREPIGPFHAGVDVAVPLWVGLTLRRRRLCRIVPPPWLDADFLKEVLEYERDTRHSTFSPYSDLPMDYVEIARAVLNACSAASGSDGGGGEESDVPRASEIGSILEDVEAVRLDRIRGDVHGLSSRGDVGAVDTVDVTGMSRAEMARVRPILVEAFRGQGELSGKNAASAEAAAAKATASAADAAADAASSRRAQRGPSRAEREGDGVGDEGDQQEEGGASSRRNEQGGDGGDEEEGGQPGRRDGEVREDEDGASSSSLPLPPRSSRIRRFR